MPAAPSPCRMRASVSNKRLSDRAQSSEATTNSTRPPICTRRYPARSPNAASGSKDMVTASWYAFTTQIDAASVTCRSCAMVGRAMLAMALSSTAITSPSATASAAQ